MENDKFRLIIRFDAADRKKYFHRTTQVVDGKVEKKTRRIDGDTFDCLRESPGFGGLTLEC